jgi:radical SAM-linked protein
VSTSLDPSASASLAAPTGPASKVRLRFSKGGSLRWLSHHDLMRTFQRMLRRAALPFRCTQGFNPHPRLVFALSLPLGVIGLAEVAELELDEVLAPQEVHDRLRGQCPPGLEILDVRAIPPRCTAQVRGLCYGVPLPDERADAVRPRLAEFLAVAECWIERQRPSGGKPRRRLDLRPFVRDLRLVGEPSRPREPSGAASAARLGGFPTAGATWLEMDLWLTSAGTARPEEVLAVLQLEDVLEAGCVLHRLRLDLEDEPSTRPAGTA